MPDASSTRRARRIERRCIAPVVEALHNGQISSRSADEFLKLSPAKQALELSRRLEEIRERETRHRVVVAAIRGYLDNLNGQRVDLHRLGGILRSALALERGA